MSVDEARIELRTQLQELFGVSGAEILMDRPPGDWSDLVTNHTLDLRFAAFEERSDRKLEALEARMDRTFDSVLAEMRAGFAAMDQKFDARFAAVDQRFDLMSAEFDAKVDRRFRSQTLVMMSTFVALSGVIVAALRF